MPIILDSNVTIEDWEMFDGIDLTQKNYNVYGTNDSDDTLEFWDMSAESITTPISNPNVWFNGKSGWDKLEYEDNNNIKRVFVEVGDFGDGYYYEASGGYKQGETEIDSFDVYLKNVEKVVLTRKDDRVDLRGLEEFTSDDPDADNYYKPVVFDGAKGEDLMRGSAYGDIFYGGSHKDTLYGFDGDDYLDGGTYDDKLYGGAGNDTLIATAGEDTLFGGAGEDYFFEHMDLTKDSSVYLYGDVEREDGVDVINTESGYNEADVFSIAFQTNSSETITTAGQSFHDFLSEKGTQTAIVTVSSIAATSMGLGWAGPTLALGYQSLQHAIEGGAKTTSMTITKDSLDAQVVVKDFDAWEDMATIKLKNIDQSSDSNVLGAFANDSGGTGTSYLSLQVDGTGFARLEADKVFTTVFDGIFEDSDNTVSIGSTEYQAIMQNVYKNGLWVHKDDDGLITVHTANTDVDNPTTDEIEGDMSHLFTEGFLDSISGDLANGEGLLLLGDYGGGTYFANGLMAVAGSNSDDVIYAGSYDRTDQDENFGDGTRNIYAGDGDDTIYGSLDGGDDLYGGKGNDYIHFGAHETGA